ncbi:MAG: hypothetical protein Q9164_007222 [Protoblastenia rupestris]
MARPFDEHNSHPTMSAMASQTSLVEAHDEYGQSWMSKRGPKEKKQRPRLPKIKSSPSHGALATTRTNHESFHKRGNSATATPTSPTFVPDYLLQTAGSSIPSSAHAAAYSPIEITKATKSRAKIRPLLRKFSSQEQVTIDLSRSAAENEGLGIYANSESAAPIRSFSGTHRRGYHHRTTSGTSEISTNTTSSNRYGVQYVHPMRQTPRPYTPPIAGSYKTSFESEIPVTSLSDDTAPTPYAPLPPTHRNISSPPHIRTGSSFTNSSQTNLPGTPSSLRFPTDITTPEMMISSTTARSSLDSAFRKRSRSNTAQTDPAQQAATVQQLRKQFQEKEAAKERKYQEAEMKAAEKEQRRRERKEEDERRTSEKRERRRARSNAASEKSSLGFGREELPLQSREGFPAMEMFPTQSQPVQLGPPPSLQSKQRSRTGTAGSKGKAVHSQWALFWFRFRTMWLRLRKKMGGKGSEG